MGTAALQIEDEIKKDCRSSPIKLLELIPSFLVGSFSQKQSLTFSTIEASTELTIYEL